MAVKSYLDAKIDLVVGHIHEGINVDEVAFIVRDVQDAFDVARAEPVLDFEAHRVRCSKLLTCAKALMRRASGKDLEYLEALEGVLLGVLAKADSGEDHER